MPFLYALVYGVTNFKFAYDVMCNKQKTITKKIQRMGIHVNVMIIID